ncbi:MAG: SMP-30/gluconolactonase/LRE family protein [Armatimonas sp.]
MDYTQTLLADYACHTGEGPLFHPDENAVYWTDIPNARIFRYDLAIGEHHAIEIGRQVGGFTIQPDGRLLLFLDKGSIALFREGEPLEYIVDEIPTETETRFNDVMADPEGRVFCGTMPTKDRLGNFYRLETDGTLTHLLSGIGCSNGMGFTPNLAQMYYTDTSPRNIYRFDYDRAIGALSNQITFVHTEEGGGFPDGMTVDADGYLWSTRWDGNCVVRYSPEGAEVGRITMPVRKVSCVTFGGENYETMFMTTAGGHIKETDGEHAGALFALKIPGIKGVPEFRSKVKL